MDPLKGTNLIQTLKIMSTVSLKINSLKITHALLNSCRMHVENQVYLNSKSIKASALRGFLRNLSSRGLNFVHKNSAPFGPESAMKKYVFLIGDYEKNLQNEKMFLDYIFILVMKRDRNF